MVRPFARAVAARSFRRRVALLFLAFAAPAQALAASGGLLPVPSVTIYPGDRITREMITDKHFYFDPARPLPVIDDAGPIIGKVARRTLPAGRPIPHNGVGEPDLVFRGTPTTARFQRGGLILQTTVLPLENGGLGERVQARNIDTGRIVNGIVLKEGVLAVGTVVGGEG